MAANIIRHPSVAELDAALAAFVAECLRAAIAERSQASLIVSGGSTPRAMLQRLSREALDWSRVAVTLADERWVDAAHADSNERMVRETLLQNAAASARFLPLKNGATTAAGGAAAVAACLDAFPFPCDVTLLGMGNDGHTASLFPGSPQLAAGLAADRGTRCLAVDAPGAAHERLSLTRSALLDTRQLIIHITGPEKWAVLMQAQADDVIDVLPVRLAIHQEKVPCHVFWTA